MSVSGRVRYFAYPFHFPVADPCSKIRHQLRIAAELVGSLNGAIHEDTWLGGRWIQSNRLQRHRKWPQSQTGRKKVPPPKYGTKHEWTTRGSVTDPPWPTRNSVAFCGKTKHNDPMSQAHHNPHTSQTFAGATPSRAAGEKLAHRWPTSFGQIVSPIPSFLPLIKDRYGTNTSISTESQHKDNECCFNIQARQQSLLLREQRNWTCHMTRNFIWSKGAKQAENDSPFRVQNLFGNYPPLKLSHWAVTKNTLPWTSLWMFLTPETWSCGNSIAYHILSYHV